MMSKPTLPLLLTFLLNLILLFSSVQAGGCDGPICGTIYNQSPWTLLYTTNPSADNNCKSCCYFWNWHNGPNGAQQTTCHQSSLAKTKSAGGSGVDVDGFTYADREYYFSGRKIIKGQWTKFATIQSVRCVSKGGVPHCCVQGDPDSAGCCWGVASGPNGIVC